MTALQTFNPAQAAWTDPATGKLTVYAQRWLRDLWIRAGGVSAMTNAELEAELSAIDDEVDALSSLVRLQRVASSPTVRGDGITVGRDAAGYVLSPDPVAFHSMLPRAAPMPMPNDSQAVLAAQIFGG